MTFDEIKLRFPRSSVSFIKANLPPQGSGVCSLQSQSTQRMPLDPALGREEAGWYDAAVGFEIVFTVYSIRPCDWDGYDIKALQDFLITAGILPDDGWKTLSGRVVSQKAATKNEERTEITIIAHELQTPSH